MVKQVIWPLTDGDPLVNVDDATYKMIKKRVEQLTVSGGEASALWDFARQIVLSERKAREKADRHARGDFTDEIREAQGIAFDISARTDGTSYDTATQIQDKLDEMRSRGFDVSDVDALIGLHLDLTEELKKTADMSGELLNAINELREAV